MICVFIVRPIDWAVGTTTIPTTQAGGWESAGRGIGKRAVCNLHMLRLATYSLTSPSRVIKPIFAKAVPMNMKTLSANNSPGKFFTIWNYDIKMITVKISRSNRPIFK